MSYEDMEWQVYLITNQVNDKGYVGLTTGNQGVRLLDRTQSDANQRGLVSSGNQGVCPLDFVDRVDYEVSVD